MLGIKMKWKSKKDELLSILLDTLSASLLRNLLICKIVKAKIVDGEQLQQVNEW